MRTFEQPVAERLAEIDARYPDAHKQQVTARLRRAWEKQPAADRIPYVVLHYRQAIACRCSVTGRSMGTALTLR